MRKVVRTKTYLKDLREIPAKDREAVEDQVQQLEGDWKGLDVKALEGSDTWRLRVRSYRVFFRLDHQGNIQIVLLLEVSRRTSTTYH